MSEIISGSRVLVRTVDGKLLPKTAISPVIDGCDFPVVWCVWDQEYDPAKAEKWERLAHRARQWRVDDLPGFPWPCEDVFLRNISAAAVPVERGAPDE